MSNENLVIALADTLKKFVDLCEVTPVKGFTEVIEEAQSLLAKVKDDPATEIGKEYVGRSVIDTRFTVSSRRYAGDGKSWYGASRYKSIQEARIALNNAGKPIDLGGGFTIGFEGGKEPFEYRISRVDSIATVLHVETRKI